MTRAVLRTVAHVPRRFTPNAWGGTERVLQETLPLLAEAGYPCVIHTTQALDPRPFWTIAGVPVTRHRYFYPQWPLDPELARRFDQKGGNLVSFPLARALAEMDELGLVHAHTGNRLGAQCLRVARQRRIPFVLTLHGGVFAVPEAERQDLLRPLPSAKPSLPWGKLLSAVWGTRHLLDRAEALICVGVDEFEAARRALPEQRIEFIPGGVSIEDFARAAGDAGRAQLGVSDERLLIVCMARIDHQKDQATLVRAWAELDVECDLALIGPETTQGYLETLRALASEASRRQHGKLLTPGAVDSGAVAALYAAADISVLPSRHEPFGLTCLETWAAKRCLVAADVGGPRWLLADEPDGRRTGRLFPVGDVRALRELLRELLTDSEQRRQLGERGFERAARDFSWQRRAQRVRALYDEVIGRAERRRSERQSRTGRSHGE